VLLVQVPATRPHDEGRGLLGQPVTLPVAGSSKLIVRRMASLRFSCPRMMFSQVGEQESSKSAMKQRTGAFSALMTILRSTGPVISTRRSVRSSGTGEMRHSAPRTWAVAARNSGSAPSSSCS